MAKRLVIVCWRANDEYTSGPSVPNDAFRGPLGAALVSVATAACHYSYHHSDYLQDLKNQHRDHQHHRCTRYEPPVYDAEALLNNPHRPFGESCVEGLAPTPYPC